MTTLPGSRPSSATSFNSEMVDFLLFSLTFSRLLSSLEFGFDLEFSTGTADQKAGAWTLGNFASLCTEFQGYKCFKGDIVTTFPAKGLKICSRGRVLNFL